MTLGKWLSGFWIGVFKSDWDYVQILRQHWEREGRRAVVILGKIVEGHALSNYFIIEQVGPSFIQILRHPA